MFPTQMVLPDDLPTQWRDQAEALREYGADAQAKAVDRCADQLEEVLLKEGDALLTLPEAAEESGYSADHIGRLIRDGKIPNAGRPGAPRIARRDLPLKVDRGVQSVSDNSQSGDISREQIVRSVINEGVR